MKKIILALTVMAFMMTVVAQDTVRYGDSCYMFNALHAPLRPWQVSPGVYQAYDTSNYINGMPPLLYIASNMVRVYGVAVTVFLREGDTDSSCIKHICAAIGMLNLKSLIALLHTRLRTASVTTLLETMVNNMKAIRQV